ncbi:MAG TPA: AAA family ATPase [Terracidiphilus sp.]|nr:AAA family ATPase [Terracidiphilus sp.]
MLTKIVIRNFKRFESVEIPLSSQVVFVGPNNSGKTTALQALALWELGLRRWREKRASGQPEKRPGVNINRRDLLMVPAPDAKQLWRKLHVRDVQRLNGKQGTKNVRIDILVSGKTRGTDWECGLEFDFTNDESFACRPLRTEETKPPSRMPIPDAAYEVEIAFLPPMSGLTSNETRLDSGAITVRLGEGRTAEVLRNLCFALNTKLGDSGEPSAWLSVVSHMRDLFNVTLEPPVYVPERGEIQMSYRDEHDIELDLSSSGRGLQQTLLLLTYLALHPGSILLLDEPDAHLEILRQREIYIKLRDVARESNSQLVIASHSEEVLNQAASTADDAVVAFLGKPHLIPGNRASTVRSALNTVRYDQYYLAEQKGWVLYLEDYTDLRILQAFARVLHHPAEASLKSPFLFATGNQIGEARKHFHALLEAKADLVSFLAVDNDAGEPQSIPQRFEMRWQRREIENYICQPATLESFAVEIGKQAAGGPLLEVVTVEQAVNSMRSAIQDRAIPAALRDLDDVWWRTMKASDEFLDLVLPDFYRRMGLYMDMRKADYYRLVEHVPADMIADEINKALDRIAETSQMAQPAAD